MAKPMMLPAALAALLALSALPALAQEAAADAGPAAAADGPGKAAKTRPAAIRLDFGAGRELRVECGATELKACVEAITPLAEKLAATPAVPARAEGKPGMERHDKKGGKHGKEGPGRDGVGKKGPEGKGPGKDAPPPPAQD